MIVYFHKNAKTNEVFYVGIGIDKDRAYRMKQKDRNKFWHNYVSKHGLPIVEIVHTVETRKEASDLELKYISEFGRRCDGSGCLVNITIGGDGGSLGMKQTADHINKRMKDRRGIKLSDAEKQRMKEVQNRPDVKATHAKYKNDPAWRELQRNIKLGGKLSEETKKKISEGNKGKVFSAETKAKISASNTGKVRTPEMRAKISAVQKGRKQTEEAIRNKVNATKKVLLNTHTGIFYHGMKEASDSLGMNINTFRSKMAGFQKNTTPFVYA